MKDVQVLHKIKKGIAEGFLVSTYEVVDFFEYHMGEADIIDWSLTTTGGITQLREYVHFTKGDVIKFTAWFRKDGVWFDAAVSQAFDDDNPYMVVTAREALIQGVLAAKDGNLLSDVSKAIQTQVWTTRYTIVTQLSGHGIGSELEMLPRVHNNHLMKHKDMVLREGMRLAIEPILLDVGDSFDLETGRTEKGTLSARYGATVEVTKDGGKILFGGI